MAATVQFGTSVNSGEQFVGMTISQVRNSNVWRTALGLSGEETVAVSSDRVNWVTANNGYVIRDGDVVRFERSNGTKG